MLIRFIEIILLLTYCFVNNYILNLTTPIDSRLNKYQCEVQCFVRKYSIKLQISSLRNEELFFFFFYNFIRVIFYYLYTPNTER
jgi:hypothetical protein